MTAKRKPDEVFATLERMKDHDEAERVLGLTDEEVTAELTAQGFDVPAVQARGAAFVQRMQAQRDIYERAANRLDRARALLASRPARREKLPRATLRERIETARNDPRFSAPAAILFRNRPVAEASDEELERLLDTIEALAEIVTADEADTPKK